MSKYRVNFVKGRNGQTVYAVEEQNPETKEWAVLKVFNNRQAAEDEKKVAIAKGNADALKIQADAEAYYNRVVAASLSNNLVQMKALEKWDGKTPIVAGGGTFVDASKFIK